MPDTVSQRIMNQRDLITNGINVTPGTYPFFAFNKFGEGRGCGASLIHEDILISAAHCRQVYEGRGAYVGAATNFGYDDGEFHEDGSVVVHPDFDPNTFHNDVMLVKLQTSSSLTPVQLNRDPAMAVTDTLLTVMGFGDTSFNGQLSSNLLQAVVSVYDFDQCAQVYATESVVLDREAQFCALDGTGLGGDACQADSGGPILDYESGIQVGIVSFGLGCGRVGVPAAYARISSYLDWIDEQVCMLSANPPDDCSSSTAINATNNISNTNSGTDDPTTDGSTASSEEDPTTLDKGDVNTTEASDSDTQTSVAVRTTSFGFSFSLSASQVLVNGIVATAAVVMLSFAVQS